jgi:hypothetical protein
LLRDGSRLLAHANQFTNGEYGKQIESGEMTEYIILDFRSKKPQRRHDG